MEPMQELTWRERGWLWLRLGLRLVLTLLTIVLVWRFAPPLLRLTMPFVVALVLTWLLNPAIRALETRLKVGRGPLSLVLVVLGIAIIGAVAAGLIYALVSQIVSFLQDWQPMWATVMSGINAVVEALEEPLSHLPGTVYERVSGLGDSFIAWLSAVVPAMLTVAAGNAGSFAMSLPSWVVSVVICVMATYFISADYPNLRARAVAFVPREFRGFFSHVRQVAAEAFGGYVRAEFILSALVTLVLLVGFWLTGERYALLLAVTFGVLDFIPIIGSGTIMVPWAVIDVALGSYRHAIGLMVIWGIIVLLRRLAEPKIVGDQTGLSPIASLISIYVGMRLGGVLGMILGPVVCLILLNIVRGGFLDNTARDLRLAVRDISAILAAGPKLDD